MKFVGSTGEYFEVLEGEHRNPSFSKAIDGQLSMLWFQEENNIVMIDAKEYTFNSNEILFLTSFNHVEFVTMNEHRFMRFNTPFYCILDHDSEVGCKGVLFYGSTHIPRLVPSSADLDILETVWKMLVIEMSSNDNLQQEMLQMMLKRILILSTRIYKAQENFGELAPVKHDIVRDFNFLVEQHFREKNTVAEYAALLNKSPKTLSNLFKKLNNRTPLQIIQDRKILEVRRMLRYTDKSISEIGYEVGFPDVQSMSRFFKKHQGVSPSEFRLKK